jgi:monoamine oxidase
MKDHVDIAIIGAGAAGIAAALRLKDTKLSMLLLEARDRVGGRAHTIRTPDGLPLDLGCEWLHSADMNALAAPLEEAGYTIDRRAPRWNRQTGNRDFTPADQQAFAKAFDAFERRLADAAARGEERAAADYFEPGCRWNLLMDAVSSYFNGTEFDDVSIQDYAAYNDTETNWRVREGYGAGIAALAGGLDPVLGCAVKRIDHSRSPIKLTTSRGDLSANAVILAAPSPILAEEKIAFFPRLAGKVDAAAGLPLGIANKAFLYLLDPDALPVEGHFFGRTDSTRIGSYLLRPFGRPYIECYFGGRLARELELAGKGAFASFAIDELAHLVGSDFRRKVRPIVETAWSTDPYALGSYSHALPGHADARASLAAPVDGRLFFAGEATHPSFFSTAHGAWESGLRAAEDALSSFPARK